MYVSSLQMQSQETSIKLVELQTFLKTQSKKDFMYLDKILSKAKDKFIK